MESYAIYAYGTPSDPKDINFIYESLTKHNISRFLWSYFDNCDLNRLKDIKWKDMSDDEKKCWKKARRLLDFKEGDWILHINVPKYGMVTAARIVSGYIYDNNLPEGQDDGRHCFKVDSVFEFDRNNACVHKYLSTRLKLQGSLWRIYCVDEFEKSKTKLQSSESKDVKGNAYLIDEATEILNKLTTTIQSNNPGKELEKFLANVFRQIPGVVDVQENGFGWRTDHGADLIVRYKEGLVSEFEEEKILIVQVKSFEGNHWDTKAVDQLKTAIEEYDDASMGIIMTTGNRTEALEKALEKLREDLKVEQKHISLHLLAGNEVAQFVLQHGMNVLLGNS